MAKGGFFEGMSGGGFCWFLLQGRVDLEVWKEKKGKCQVRSVFERVSHGLVAVYGCS